jgi:hypothetical protein
LPVEEVERIDRQEHCERIDVAFFHAGYIT